jgi:glycerol-3-phosphate dehydrogenase
MAERLDHAGAPDARAHTLGRLQRDVFDLLVIGGGINGAGIARDAAMRGLRVALVEKGDFASGTSSKSSKLIHGGVRYLQQGDLRLVWVACRERDLLRRRLAPHLVRPLPFLFPVYRGDPVGLFALGVGMWIYDALAAFRNIRAHRMLSLKRTLELEPKLRRQGLRGAALYYDCWTDDARLTLETALGAREEGAVIANYIELDGFIKEAGRIVGASLRDCLAGTRFEIRARCVVNASGPWADHVRHLDDAGAAPCLRPTKGVHIVVPRARLGNTHAVVMHSPRDKRVLFAIPWGEHDIVGTTDTDFSGSPDQVVADENDVEYLLESINWFFPQARLRPDEIVSSYAGLRPLVAPADDRDPSAVSREEAVLQSASGLITLAGGKLTTYRWVAKEIVDQVTQRLGLKPKRLRGGSRTARKPLPGGHLATPQGQTIADLLAQDGFGLSHEQLEHLLHRYGSRTPHVLQLIRERSDLSEILVPGLPDIWAEAAYAAQSEMAVEPDDVLLRRTKIGLKEPAESAQLADLIKAKIRLFRGGR